MAKPATPDRSPVSRPATGATPNAPVARIIPDCEIETMPNGEGVAILQIPADVMRRLKTRSGSRELGDFVWQDVLRPALYAATY
jgi:hypothetical protein